MDSLSKSDLANLIGVHYSQIGRYENKGAQPSADVLAKLANALGVTTDFLMNGTADNLANNSLSDKELLNQFKYIEKLSESDRQIIYKLFLQLKENPYVGDAIRFRFFREKRLREKRIYFLVYEDFNRHK